MSEFIITWLMFGILSLGVDASVPVNMVCEILSVEPTIYRLKVNFKCVMSISSLKYEFYGIVYSEDLHRKNEENKYKEYY